MRKQRELPAGVAMERTAGETIGSRSLLWRRKWRSLLLISLGIAVAFMVHWPIAVVAQSASGSEAMSPSSELRGVWLTNVDSDVLFSRDKLEAGIERLTRLHFNTIYPTVWNGGYTLYPSKVAEKWIGAVVEPVPEFEGRDMLAEAIELAHAQGLAVIPWYEFGLMTLEDSDIARRHPDWIMSRRDGTQVFVQGDQGQHRFVWLNPAHPDVQEMIGDLMVEVVSNYDIDGIQFDDHFGTPVELGYDDYTVQLYQQEHGGNRPPDDSTDPEWMRWRSRNVTTMMVKIFSRIKTRRPDCLISLSPNPQEFSYEHYLQDWAPWVRLGFINELIVQIYRSEMEPFLSELDQPELRAIRNKLPVSIGILTGLRVLKVETAQIENQVQTTRDRQFAGVSFFFYGSLSDHQDATYQSLFPTPATRPGMPNYATGS